MRDMIDGNIAGFFLPISAKALARLYGSWNALINAPVAGLAACHLQRSQM